MLIAQVNLTSLAPVIATVLYVGASLFYYYCFGIHKSIHRPEASVPATPAVGTGQAHARLDAAKVLWVVTAVGMLLSMLCCAGISSVIIAKLHAHFTAGAQLIGFSVLGLLLVAGSVFFFRFEVSGATGLNLIEGIETNAVAGMTKVTAIHNLLACATIILLACSCSVLAAVTQSAGVTEIGARVKAFNLLMYSASAFLTFGFLEILSLWKWAALSRATADNASAYFAQAYVTAMGIYLTFFLIIIFAPVAFIINDQVSMLASHASVGLGSDKTFDLQRWLLEARIENLPFSGLGAYVAMLIPAVVGIGTSALEKTFEK